MYIKKTALIITSFLLLAGCTVVKQTPPSASKTNEVVAKVVPDKPTTAKKWTTYTNAEYGIAFDYPSDLGGNKLSVTQVGNKFSIVGLNDANSEFSVPFVIGLNIKSKAELTKFIKKEYDPACELGDIDYSKAKDGLVPVNILMNGSLEEGGCWIDWVTLLKYAPEKQKIVAINLGQEPPIFEYGDNGLIDYTQKTADSFRFTN